MQWDLDGVSYRMSSPGEHLIPKAKLQPALPAIDSANLRQTSPAVAHGRRRHGKAL